MAHRGQEFVVDESSACIDGYPKYGLGLDHFNLNKFASPEDGHYKAVKRQVQKMAKEAAENLLARSRYVMTTFRPSILETEFGFSDLNDKIVNVKSLENTLLIFQC